MATCAMLSFRLGLPDGVSIVAGAWRRALHQMGWDTVTIAGEGPVDRLIPWLEIGSSVEPHQDQLRAALVDVDVVVVENLLTIPMHLPASRAVAEVLRGRPAVLHHHDPPWQRARFAHVTELPPDDPAWRHVTINEMTRRELSERGVDAVTILNGFDVPQAFGDRAGTRQRLGIQESTTLIAHPVRAIARKNIPAAIALTEQLDGAYWLTGQAEEDFGPALNGLFSSASCPIIHRSVGDVGVSIADLYAACDLVAFPSTWEGFGNPLIEASLHRRPAVVAHYPVLDELVGLGFEWLSINDLPAIKAELAAPNQARLERNQEIAGRELSMDALLHRLQDLFDRAGWRP